jgi:phosphoglucosamine mutase
MKLFGSSGIRAVFNQELLRLAFRVGLAVGKNHRRVVVGTDTRTSADAMKHAVLSGLLAAGARAADAGICPTPTLAYAARDFDAAVMLTASHNPPEYNGVKLLNPDGSSFATAQQGAIEAAVLAESYEVAGWQDVKKSETYEGAVTRHIAAIREHFPDKLDLRVVVDAGGGAAYRITPRLLEELGGEVVPLNCTPDGRFPRPSEPTEESLADLCRVVRETGAALGIAHDGDADRMMAVDERGRFIPGDKLLVMLARAVGAREVVTTLDASMTIEAEGFAIRRTRIGDTWVSAELRKGGDFGGETSGSWIFPAISLCPDGIYAAAQIASLAAREPLAALADAIPAYPLQRGSLAGSELDMARLKENLIKLRPASVSNTDGIKLVFEDGWLLVRPSGTEPKIRLTAEARTEARTHRLYEDGAKAVRDSVATGSEAS